VSAAATIVLLWLGFAITHILMSSVSLRPRLAGVLGDRGFQGVYSLVALAFFVPLVMVYFDHKHEGALLWTIAVGPGLRWLINIGMGVAFVLLIAGVMNASPASMTAAPADGPAQHSGVHFITRHAVFMATALFGILHLIPNGYATDIAFFAGFPVFVLIGSIHQDRRKLATDPERYQAYHDATPLIPFSGANTLRGLKEMSKLAVVIGIVVTILLRYFHTNLFG